MALVRFVSAFMYGFLGKAGLFAFFLFKIDLTISLFGLPIVEFNFKG